MSWHTRQGCGACRLSAQALIPRSKTMDHHERGYLAEEWTIVRWYDMPQITRGRGPPRRRAVIRNVMTEETREIPLTRCMACGYWSVHWCPCFRCGFPFCTRESCSTRNTFRATNWRNRMWGSVTLCTHCHAYANLPTPCLYPTLKIKHGEQLQILMY